MSKASLHSAGLHGAKSELFSFFVENNDVATAARAACFATDHGVIHTPVFMPVGTQATVKGILPTQLLELQAQIILSNTYHLYLRPSAQLIASAGGLHRFMGWNKPILTDSGGFQIFSLRDTLKLDDDGVSFKSILDGSMHRWTPEENMRIQGLLGADIIMQLDECPPYPASYAQVEAAVKRSASWAKRCLHYHLFNGRDDQGLFAIVQGGVFEDLRLQSITSLLACEEDVISQACLQAGKVADNVAASKNPGSVRGFAGYGIGGYSVGESHDEMFETLGTVAAALPISKPRYLMGVGNPTTLLKAIAVGIDMFDCVLPTRTARMGTAFSSQGRLNLRNARFKSDFAALDSACGCSTCQNFSRAYLRHLVISKEMLGSILLSVHNIHFLTNLMSQAREAILANSYAQFLRSWMDSPAANDY